MNAKIHQWIARARELEGAVPTAAPAEEMAPEVAAIIDTAAGQGAAPA